MSLGDAPHGQALATIAVPALIIHGSDQNQMSGDGGPGLAAILPHSKLITIANAGHDPWLDQPNSFFAAANKFVSEVVQHTRIRTQNDR
jgi:pimeloyl-ACP methyl ester carboxylesterase